MKRILGIDVMRTIAAIAIVWLHAMETGRATTGWDNIGRFAVPYFTATTTFLIVFLLGERLKEGKIVCIWGYFKSRFYRIYIPFALWSLIYFIIRFLNASFFSRENTVFVPKDVLFSGTAHHLWFLPFIFWVSFLTCLLTCFLFRKHLVNILIASLFFFIGNIFLFIPGSQSFFKSFGYSSSLIWKTMPSAIFGIGLALCFLSGHLRLSYMTKYRQFFLFLWVILVLSCLGGRNYYLENITGFVSLLFAVSLCVSQHSKLGVLFINLSKYSYFIYLSHILFVEGVKDILAQFKISSGVLLSVFVFVISLFLSAFLAKIIGKLRFGKWLGADI